MARRLPVWMADGPTVSDTAYRICVRAFGDPILPWTQTHTAVVKCISNVEVVEFLAQELDVDEQDVLEALAELERAGVLVKEGEA